MRQRNVKNCDLILEKSDKYIKSAEDMKKYISSAKYNMLCLEIGIGKGAFIAENARRHKDNLYIGIELNRGVVSLASKKIARFEEENGKLDNLKIMDFDALNLEEILGCEKVDRLYLNFSDPWPKKKHEKRRLTSDNFLNVYKKILKTNASIEFKTDNRGLFEYSIMNMNKNNMKIDFLSLNLHEDIERGKLKEMEPNIMTEYEEKFMQNGPIYKMIARF